MSKKLVAQWGSHVHGYSYLEASDKPALKGSIVEPVLFNVLISDVEEVRGCALIKFAVDTKLGGAANMLKGRATIQRELDRLEGSASLVKFREELLNSPEESDCDPRCSCRAAEPQGWLFPSSTGERPSARM